MPYLIIGFGLWYLLILLGSLALQVGVLQSADSQARVMATRFVAGNVMNQIIDTGTPPVSLAVASTQPGYEDLRLEINRPWQGYAVSPIMTDGTWQFQRAVVFSQKTNTAVNTTSYLAANACGTNDFASPGPWCGSKNSYWWLYDSRTEYTNQIEMEKLAQRRILQKFAQTYGTVTDNRQVFPNPDSPSATLASLAGYGGTAANCTGLYTWGAVPLDCSDFFSVWGTPRVYNYVTEDYIAVVTTSTISDATGNPVPVATQLDLRTRVFPH
jgi:hypothetical protein